MGAKELDAEKTASRVRLFIYFAAGMAGLLFGLDQGVISGALPFISREWNLSSSAQEWVSYVAAIMTMVSIAGFGMSAGPIVWVLCSEIQPLKSREFGIACSTMTNWITCAIVGATFLTLVDTLGSAHTFWLYALMNAFFIILTMAYVPETKNVSLEKIEHNLMSGEKLRRIGC